MIDLAIIMKAKPTSVSLNGVILFLAIVIGLGLRLYPIVTEQVFFHFDSARDWLWVRDIAASKKPMLVGPWSSLQGVFYGPLTYYLLVPFFVAFAGDPIGGSILALLMQVVAMGCFYVLMRRVVHPRAAAISLFLLAISPQTVYISTFIFQSNSSFGLGVMWLWGLWLISQKRDSGLVLAMLALGLGVHTNLFFTVFLTPFLGFLLWLKKWKLNFKVLNVSILVFALLLLPQIAFELRHDFIQTKSLWQFMAGQNTSLGIKLDLIARVKDRNNVIWEIIKQSL